MSLDDRDWYREELRKKQGYTERSRFRVNVGVTRREVVRREHRDGWWTLLVYALAWVGVLAILFTVVRLWLLGKV